MIQTTLSVCRKACESDIAIIYSLIKSTINLMHQMIGSMPYTTVYYLKGVAIYTYNTCNVVTLFWAILVSHTQDQLHRYKISTKIDNKEEDRLVVNTLFSYRPVKVRKDHDCNTSKRQLHQNMAISY